MHRPTSSLTKGGDAAHRGRNRTQWHRKKWHTQTISPTPFPQEEAQEGCIKHHSPYVTPAGERPHIEYPCLPKCTYGPQWRGCSRRRRRARATSTIDGESLSMRSVMDQNSLQFCKKTCCD